ncbi:hypothetical protein EIP91_001157 [Steccherinum ochraceum]|uniref:AB hydrolase-1 domain-containing protein n=1 Tax=Steccherinum ochraceum TaxID=92696 RepID=A0A4R0REG8_9APHY|nr:hypothetical protein EIP91_001157 [Steccherinum ochraceum]
MLQYAAKHNVRIVLVNRRGYPGAAQYTEEELAQLKTGNSGPSPEAANAVRDHLKDRVKEIYELLETFIMKKNITTDGGIVLGGWSMATLFATAFLAYGPAIPVGKINVVSYIKRIVAYDAIYLCMEYPLCTSGYSPFSNPDLPPGEAANRFPAWVSGYYSHGDGHTLSDLEMRDALQDPKPTVVAMSQDDLEYAMYPAGGAPDGADMTFYMGALSNGILKEVREEALMRTQVEGGEEWARVAWRHVWGDRSIWEVPCTYPLGCIQSLGCTLKSFNDEYITLLYPRAPPSDLWPSRFHALTPHRLPASPLSRLAAFPPPRLAAFPPCRSPALPALLAALPPCRFPACSPHRLTASSPSILLAFMLSLPPVPELSRYAPMCSQSSIIHADVNLPGFLKPPSSLLSFITAVTAPRLYHT